jgi:hypothetical protein
VTCPPSRLAVGGPDAILLAFTLSRAEREPGDLGQQVGVIPGDLLEFDDPAALPTAVGRPHRACRRVIPSCRARFLDLAWPAFLAGVIAE